MHQWGGFVPMIIVRAPDGEIRLINNGGIDQIDSLLELTTKSP